MRSLMQLGPQFARGAATCGAFVACEAGTHYAASTPGAQGLGLMVVVAPLLAIGLAAAARTSQRVWLLPLWVLGCVALWLLRAPLGRHFAWGAYFEHLAINLVMAYVFGRTLAAGRRPLCSQFAAVVHGTLTPAVEQYTRQVTVAWTVFFLTIAGVSTLLFAVSSVVVWSTFANYMTLPLVAVMFIGEHVWRRVALPEMQRSSLLAVVRACRETLQRNEPQHEPRHAQQNGQRSGQLSGQLGGQLSGQLGARLGTPAAAQRPMRAALHARPERVQ